MLNAILFQLITLLNYFSNIYIFFIFFIFGYLEIVSECFIVLSLVAIFTQGFSANSRNIYLGSNIFNLNKIILFRVLVSVAGFILTILITYIFIGKSNILLHSSIVFLTTSNWILELLIARYEKLRFVNIYHIVNLFLLIFFSTILIFLKNIFILSVIIYCSSIINILIFKNSFKNIFNQNIISKKINFNSLGVFSTLSKTLTNFFWRYFTITLVGKTDSSLLFMGFSMGSFFGTLFDVSYGAFFLKKIQKKKLFINFIFIIYIILSILFIYFLKNVSFLEREQFTFFLNTTLFSICGSYFLVLALHQRQFLFEKINFVKICYKADICIYFFNFLIIPILYYFNHKYLITTYFVSSLFCFFVYIIYIRNVYSKKIY
jgi:hypothetical protein